MNTTIHDRVLRHMEFHVLELSKFNKTESELKNIVDKWAFMFQTADKHKIIPQTLKKSEAITDAFRLLEQGNWTGREMEAHYRFMEAMNAERALKRAGFLEGKAEGKAEGKTEGMQQVAKHVLAKGSDLKCIQEVTELSTEEIEKLK